MSLFDEKPAEVRPAEDANALIGEGFAHCHAADLDARRSLDGRRKAGLAFIRAKKLVAPGQWAAAVERQRPGQLRTVQRAMWVAKNWARVHAAKSLDEALRVAHAADAQEPADDGDENDRLSFSGSDAGRGDEPKSPPANGKRRAWGVSPAEPGTLAGWLPRARQLANRLKAVQEELSLMLAEEPARSAVEQAASLSSQLKLFRTGQVVKLGEHESGETAGPPEYTCDALQTLQLMAGRLISAIERETT